MTNRRSIYRSLTLLILGGTGLATWLAGACGTDDQNSETGPKVGLASDTPLGPPDNATLEPMDHVPTDYGVFPGGQLWHKDCVHIVPDGAFVHADGSVTVDGKTVAQYGKCKHPVYRAVGPAASAGAGAVAGPQGNGWVVSGWANMAPSPYTMFTEMDAGQFTVPPDPTSAVGQAVFLFPSFQSTGSYIVQPVLQWGTGSAGGGGNYWSYVSWAVYMQTGMYATSAKRAYAGDVMSGKLSLIYNDVYNGTPRQTWQITTNDVTQNTSASINAELQNPGNFINAQAGVLEAYGVNDCTDLPFGYGGGNTYFSHPLLYEGYSYLDRFFSTPSFFPNVSYTGDGWSGGPWCCLNVSTFSNGDTTLYY